MRPGIVWGIARAEMRLTRRLVRYWVFVAISTLMCALGYAQFVGIHYFMSGYSASAASANPRFWLGNYGTNLIYFFLFGLVFLGFDLRSRDQRERMDEVLDSRPYGNLELILGKALGLLVPSWVPAAVVVVLLAIAGLILDYPLEPLSTIGLLVFMSLPAYVFTIGAVYSVTLLVRHRLLASVLLLALLVGGFLVPAWWVPLYATDAIDVTGGWSMPFPSDLVPSLIALDGLQQRAGYLLLGLGLLWLAAVLHPRRDDSKRSTLALAGAAMVGVAALLLGARVVQDYGIVQQREAWLEAHREAAPAAEADVERLVGDVRIEPGDVLSAELALDVRAPADSPLESAVFTLNPGLEVGEARVADGAAIDFEQHDGLLVLRLPSAVPAGDSVRVEMKIAGVPDPRFCYLDAVVDPLRLPPAKAQIVLLGYEPMIFHRRGVVLLPGLDWLPRSGTAVRSGDVDRPPDFFKIDLTVDVPEGWRVAGPGAPRPAEAAAEPGRERYRFEPGGWMPGVALVAGRYESLTTEIDDVRLAMLISPKHTDNVELFDDSVDEIRGWLAERLEEASEFGLDYPYDGLTLVEVPNVLRGYGGGWRMDSTLIQPGMILMREGGFPTARFDRIDFERFREREGGIPRAKRQALARFFENDINGGNPFVAAARSFFGFQTAGRGPEALPLDFVWETLSTRLLAERNAYFSVHFFDDQFPARFGEAGNLMRDPDRVGDSYSDVLIHLLTSTTRVWDTALETSLVDLDPWEDPKRAINVLALKGGAMARSMLDAFGARKTGRFLAALRERAAGRGFTREDVVAAGREVGEDLDAWIDLWVNGTRLPGFTLGEVRYERIRDADDGTPRYQTRVVLRNEEPADGVVRLEYLTEGEAANARREQGESLLIEGLSAVEAGLVTSEPLQTLRVVPYFSLNRDPFNVPLPPLDDEEIVDAEPMTDVRPIAWEPGSDATIVVDDLDEGFAVAESEAGTGLRVTGRGKKDEQLDRGLPVARGSERPRRWSRRSASFAYGKYRKTMAVVRAGEGSGDAVFTARLPESGAWKLEIYLPADPSPRAPERGSWKLTVVDANGDEQAVDFDATGGESGWNDVGRFEVPSGEVELRVSSLGDGEIVLADAIRWTPAGRDPGDVASR